jgi:MYXO-CTERM domain-containing protein
MLNLIYAFIIGVILFTPLDEILLGLLIALAIGWWRRRFRK